MYGLWVQSTACSAVINISTQWPINMEAAVKRNVSPRRPWIHTISMHCSGLKSVWRTYDAVYVQQRHAYMAEDDSVAIMGVGGAHSQKDLKEVLTIAAHLLGLI